MIIWILVDCLVFYSIFLFDDIYVYMIIHELMQNQGLLTLILNNNKSLNCSIFA